MNTRIRDTKASNYLLRYVKDVSLTQHSIEKNIRFRNKIVWSLGKGKKNDDFSYLLFSLQFTISPNPLLPRSTEPRRTYIRLTTQPGIVEGLLIYTQTRAHPRSRAHTHTYIRTNIGLETHSRVTRRAYRNILSLSAKKSLRIFVQNWYARLGDL